MLGQHMFGIYEKAFDPSCSWPERLEKAKNVGFDYMEMSIDEQDERIERLYWSRRKCMELYRASFEHEMPFRSMCLSAHRRFPFGSADVVLREKAYQLMKRAIDFSCMMGIRVIQLAGYDVYYEASTPDSAKRFAEGMEWAAEQAEKNQVMLGMEIMDTRFMNSIYKHLNYEINIASPWYKMYPDLGNLSAWPENDPEKELAEGIASIVGIHVKDTEAVSEGYPGKFRDVDFGSGCVNFAQRFAQLERLGYKGPYMMEMWYRPERDEMGAIRSAKAYIEQQFAAGREM